MTTKYLTEDLRDEYEHFLKSQQTSLFYHSYQYKSFLEDLLGCESQYVLEYNQGKMTAALPLMMKEGSLGKVINSLPYYGSNGGFIGKTAAPTFVDKFKEMILNDYASITLISSPFKDSISFLQDTITNQRYSQITSLKTHKTPEDYLWSIIEGSTRRNIKKAQREGITISVENASAISFLEEIHLDNMNSIGGKAKRKDFFLKIPQHFLENKDYKIIVAKIDNQPIAALLAFYYNKTVEYFTPVIKHEFKDQQPLALILWETILQAIRDGYQYWNWGGTWLTQKGVYQFKKKLGATERVYNYSTAIMNEEIQDRDNTLLEKEYYGFYTHNFDQTKNEI